MEEEKLETATKDKLKALKLQKNKPLEETKKGDWKKNLLSWVIIILVAFFLAKIVNEFVIEKVKTPTGSMEPTVKTTDRLLMFKLAYLFSKPDRGDIVVFEDPANPEKDLLKRIIGLPGETISFYNGAVYINGKRLEESYLHGVQTQDKGTTEFVIPKDCYFMMGDNRSNSMDSRGWAQPFVHEKYIKGRVFFRYSPTIGFLE